jgi:hypothetical protein
MTDRGGVHLGMLCPGPDVAGQLKLPPGSSISFSALPVHLLPHLGQSPSADSLASEQVTGTSWSFHSCCDGWVSCAPSFSAVPRPTLTSECNRKPLVLGPLEPGATRSGMCGDRMTRVWEEAGSEVHSAHARGLLLSCTGLRCAVPHPLCRAFFSSSFQSRGLLRSSCPLIFRLQKMTCTVFCSNEIEPEVQ